MMERNKIYNMDCLEGMRQIEKSSVDLIITDPPYYIQNLMKHDLRGKTLRRSSKNDVFYDEFDHFESLDDYKKFISDVLDQLMRVMRDKAQGYIFFSFHHIDWMIRMLKDKGFRYFRPLIWYKRNTCGLFPNQYGYNYEMILWFRKRGKENNVTLHIGCAQKDVFDVNGHLNTYRKECGFHPTPKPVALIRQLIENSSDPGDLVLDPFMGSGTTAKACQESQRKYIGFELDQKWIDVSLKRLEQKQLWAWPSI